MQLKLIRDGLKPGYTTGKLFIDGKLFCYTLEDTVRPQGVKVDGATAIAPGTYRVIISMSPRFKRLMPLLLEVPGFTGVRIHAGNRAEDTEGCVLVGFERLPGGVISKSKLAFQGLMERLNPGEDNFIEIQNQTELDI